MLPKLVKILIFKDLESLWADGAKRLGKGGLEEVEDWVLICLPWVCGYLYVCIYLCMYIFLCVREACGPCHLDLILSRENKQYHGQWDKWHLISFRVLFCHSSGWCLKGCEILQKLSSCLQPPWCALAGKVLQCWMGPKSRLQKALAGFVSLWDLLEMIATSQIWIKLVSVFESYVELYMYVYTQLYSTSLISVENSQKYV